MHKLMISELHNIWGNYVIYQLAIYQDGMGDRDWDHNMYCKRQLKLYSRHIFKRRSLQKPYWVTLLVSDSPHDKSN